MNPRPRRHAFVLLPRHSLLAASAAAEALVAVNEVLGEQRYEPLLLSVDGQPVPAACGTRVAVAGALASAQAALPLAAAYVVADHLPQGGAGLADPEPLAQRALATWLR